MAYTSSSAPAPRTAVPRGARARLLLRHLRVSRVAWLGDFFHKGRLLGIVMMVTTEAVMTFYLWSAVLDERGRGVDRDAAITYAVLAVVITRLRSSPRALIARDSVAQHIRAGSIAYWHLRPMSPGRYYAVRALGDQGYALCWIALALVLLLATGTVSGPADTAAGAVSAVSALLGFVINYYLLLLIDLLCFWTVVNDSATGILQLLVIALSGGYAPLWFFPEWFLTVSSCLPFQQTLHVPLSIYVGRLSGPEALGELAVQAVWCVLFALTTRALWGRAGARLTVQGG